MFTLSSKAVYGLTAVVELAQHYRSGPLQIKDIAARHGIPQHYLEQILSALRRTGLVQSFRGARGGYVLAHHPDTIRLIDVLAELEGPLALIPVAQRSNALGFLWNNIESTIERLLSQTLGELLRDQARTTVDADFII